MDEVNRVSRGQTSPIEVQRSLLQSGDRQISPYHAFHKLGEELHGLNGDNTPEMYRRIRELSNLLYYFLANRDVRNFSSPGRVRTLQDSEGSYPADQVPVPLQTQGQNLGENAPFNHKQETAADYVTMPVAVSSPGKLGPFTRHKNNTEPEWTGQSNEVLRLMGVPEVSPKELQDAAQSGKANPLPYPDEITPESYSYRRVETTNAETTNTEGTFTPEENFTTLQSAGRKEQKQRSFPYFSKPSGHGIDPLSIAATIAGLSGVAMQTSMAIKQLLREHVYQIDELAKLSQRMTLFSYVLEQAARIMAASASDSIQHMGIEVIEECHHIFKELNYLVERALPKQGIGSRIVATYHWQKNHLKILSFLEELESLQTNISMILQIHQEHMSMENDQRIIDVISQLREMLKTLHPSREYTLPNMGKH